MEKYLQENEWNSIAKFLAKETDIEEEGKLKVWIKSDPQNQEEFEAIRKTWEKCKDVERKIDLDENFAKIKEKIAQKQQSPYLSLHEPKGLRIHRNTMIRIAAAVVLLLGIWFLLRQHSSDEKLLSFSTDEQKSVFNLPDGSTVHLNKFSKIEYPPVFGNKNRNVKLSGEAWFEVKADKNSPFMIEASQGKIQVLGTSFEVMAYPDSSNIQVVVASGLVELKNILEQIVLLDPGMRGTIDKKNNSINKSVNKDLNYLFWRTGKLVFKDTPLSEVVEVLKKNYEVEISFGDATISQLKLTATFDNQSIESIIEVIVNIFSLKSKNSGNVIELWK